MKRLAGFSALALIVSSTSGCGWLWGENGYFRDRGSDYLEARQTAPMQLPADVQAKLLPNEQYAKVRPIEDAAAWEKSAKALPQLWQEHVIIEMR